MTRECSPPLAPSSSSPTRKQLALGKAEYESPATCICLGSCPRASVEIAVAVRFSRPYHSIAHALSLSSIIVATLTMARRTFWPPHGRCRQVPPGGGVNIAFAQRNARFLPQVSCCWNALYSVLILRTSCYNAFGCKMGLNAKWALTWNTESNQAWMAMTIAGIKSLGSSSPMLEVRLLNAQQILTNSHPLRIV